MRVHAPHERKYIRKGLDELLTLAKQAAPQEKPAAKKKTSAAATR